MEKLVGTLEKKERLRSAKGTEYFAVTVSGVKMSAFREKMGQVEGAREGDSVEVEWELDKTGRYKNLVSLAIQTGAAPAPADHAGQTGREIGIARLALGHDVAAILTKSTGDFGWLEENRDRVLHLYESMVNALLLSHLNAVYGPEE